MNWNILCNVSIHIIISEKSIFLVSWTHVLKWFHVHCTKSKSNDDSDGKYLSSKRSYMLTLNLTHNY